MLVLKTAAVIFAFVALVPLFVLGATTSWRHAWFALVEYLKAMAVIVVPVLVVVALIG